MSVPKPGPTQSVSNLIYREGTPDHADPHELFAVESKLYRATMAREAMPSVVIHGNPYYRAGVPRSTKAYASSRVIPLPEPEIPNVPLSVALRSRRTRYARKCSPVGIAELSTLLFGGYGVTGASTESDVKLRTTPSGGGLYPLDLFWINQNVTGLDLGVYHYNPFKHALEVLQTGDMKERLAPALVQPEMCDEKIGHLIITASWWRSRFKYGLRGCRFPLIEAGHVAQNVLLVAEASKIMAVCVCGYFDNLMDAIVNVDGVNETTVYVIALSKLNE